MNQKRKRIYPLPIHTKNLQFNGFINRMEIELRNGNQIKIDKGLLLLISNHFENISSVIGTFSHHLFMSEKAVSEKIAKGTSAKVDSNLVEMYEEQSLNAAIIFANSSFDYMQILVALLFVPVDELTKVATIKEIHKKMKKSGLESQDWYLAFFSIIQKYFQESRFSDKGWYALHKNKIPTSILKSYEELEKLVSRLRKEYQANILKHYGITAFSKSDQTNILRRSYANFSIEEFFSKHIKKVGIGSRKNELELDSTRDFLFDYLSKMVSLHDNLYALITSSKST